MARTIPAGDLTCDAVHGTIQAFEPADENGGAETVESMQPDTRLRPARTLETLTATQSLRLLARAQIGRAVFTVGALPAVVPVTFAVDGDGVVIRTGADTRLAGSADGQVMAFEVDELDTVNRTGWSVVVTGVAEIVTDADERAQADTSVLAWTPGDRDVFIRLPFGMVTGRRIAGPSPS